MGSCGASLPGAIELDWDVSSIAAMLATAAAAIAGIPSLAAQYIGWEDVSPSPHQVLCCTAMVFRPAWRRHMILKDQSARGRPVDRLGLASRVCVARPGRCAELKPSNPLHWSALALALLASGVALRLERTVGHHRARLRGRGCSVDRTAVGGTSFRTLGFVAIGVAWVQRGRTRDVRPRRRRLPC